MATERDVIYRLKVAAGDDVQRNLKAFERHVSDAYGAMSKNAGMAARQQVAASKNATSQITAHLAQQQVAQQQASQAAAASSQQAAASSQKAAAATSQSFEQAVGKINAGNEAMVGGFNQTGEGVLKLGRGFALLGVSGEDDVKKLLEVLLRVQGVVDVTRGAIEVYQGLTRGVRAYRSAVIASTAAETALGVARARSAAAGGASVGAGAAGAAGAAGVGVIPRVGGVLARGAGVVGSAVTSTVGATLGIAGGIGLGVATLTNAGGTRDRLAQTGLSKGLGGIIGRFRGDTQEAKQRQARLLEQEQERQTQIEGAGVAGQAILARQSILGQRSDQIGAGGDATSLRDQGMFLRDTRRKLGREARDIKGPGSDTTQLANLTAQADTSARILANDKERLALARETGQARIDSARQALSIAENERDVAKATTAEARNRLKSDLERFDALNAAEKNRLRQVRRKIDTGSTLTRSDTDLAGQFAEFEEDASRARVSRARAAGGDAIFTADRAGLDAARTREAAAEALVIKREDKISIAISRDEETTDQILSEVKKSLVESNRIINLKLDKELEQVRQSVVDAANRRRV